MKRAFLKLWLSILREKRDQLNFQLMRLDRWTRRTERKLNAL